MKNKQSQNLSIEYTRPPSQHPKMDISNRAKQFMPFSALKGLNEALEKAEQETLKQLFLEVEPEETNEISRKMQKRE